MREAAAFGGEEETGEGGGVSTRIRFMQYDVHHSTVHGPDQARGFPLPADCDGWEPFQVEFRSSTKGIHYITLAIWLREVER